MQDHVVDRLTDLARRCGLKDASPQVVAAFVVVCVAVLAWGVWRWWPQAPATDPANVGFSAADVAARGAGEHESAVPSDEARAKPSRDASAVAGVLVHVVGAVRHPGVYAVTEGARVRDVIDLAGGMLPDAAPQLINLARPVSDGEQVVVPSEDDVTAGTGAPAAAGGAGGGGSAGGAAGPVNINTADVALLDTLPGIGPSTAQKIVADREANGAFKSVEDLGRISGIGPKKIEQLKEVACAR